MVVTPNTFPSEAEIIDATATGRLPYVYVQEMLAKVTAADVLGKDLRQKFDPISRAYHCLTHSIDELEPPLSERLETLVVRTSEALDSMMPKDGTQMNEARLLMHNTPADLFAAELLLRTVVDHSMSNHSAGSEKIAKITTEQLQ